MAKFNQGNLVLTATQKIIQGNDTLIGANGAAFLSSLELSGSLEVTGVSSLSALTVSDLAELDSLEVTGATDLASLSVAGTTELDTLTVLSTANLNSLGVDGTTLLNTLVVSSTAELASIKLPAGATIVEFSIDGSLSGDSDTVVPTEKAVKAYVDAQIGGLTTDHNDLINLQGGDATSSEYYHLTESIYNALYSASPLIGIGNPSGTNIEVDYGNDIISGYVDNENFLSMSKTLQAFGGDTYIAVDQTSDVVIVPDGYESLLGLTYNEQTLGITSKVNINIDQVTNSLSIKDSTSVISNFDTSLIDLKSGSIRMFSNDSDPLATFSYNGISFYHEGVKVAETSSDGISGAVWG